MNNELICLGNDAHHTGVGIQRFSQKSQSKLATKGLKLISQSDRAANQVKYLALNEA